MKSSLLYEPRNGAYNHTNLFRTPGPKLWNRPCCMSLAMGPTSASRRCNNQKVSSSCLAHFSALMTNGFNILTMFFISFRTAFKWVVCKCVVVFFQNKYLLMFRLLFAAKETWESLLNSLMSVADAGVPSSSALQILWDISIQEQTKIIDGHSRLDCEALTLQQTY